MFQRNIMLVIGIITLLVGLALSVLWLSQSATPKVETAAEIEKAQSSILVAAHPIIAGSLLHPEDMAWKEVPQATIAANNLVRGSVSEPNFIGAVTRRNFENQEALTADSIVQAKDRDFLSAVLSPGYRAVSIAVDTAQGEAGLVMPGDRVDIILTQNLSNLEGNSAHKSVGETILHDRRVIAVDMRLPSSSKPASPDQHIDTQNTSSQRTVTLELTEYEAEQILVAIQIGKVALSVRALEGSGIESAKSEEEIIPVWASDVSPALKSLGQVLPKEFVPSESALKSRDLIEIIRGDKIEQH